MGSVVLTVLIIVLLVLAVLLRWRRGSWSAVSSIGSNLFSGLFGDSVDNLNKKAAIEQKRAESLKALLQAKQKLANARNANARLRRRISSLDKPSVVVARRKHR